MSDPDVPRTVKAISTAQLVLLDEEATRYGFSRRHGVAWLTEYADPGATQYLYPAFVHHLDHRPECSPQWRCMLLLALRDGEQVFSLLDVLPASFDELPDTLDHTTKTRIADKLLGPLQTAAEWCQRHS
ncbi:hypothetical protein Sru01_05210 [Sphaerisporangium rufum]|uniref:Uncharacterized protein n=2 Tax=Sphaerisporangium rufum TaxID=1381558 RepID=A0A919UX75_9ACTN|nr:hypothetical protein Sru01_05210 [Sphaerisporangium rufum]